MVLAAEGQVSHRPLVEARLYEELKRLRQEHKHLKEERDILKAAAGRSSTKVSFGSVLGARTAHAHRPRQPIRG